MKEYTEEEVRLIIEGAIAAEREACAKWFDSEEDRPFYGRHVAAAIRKRGQE